MAEMVTLSETLKALRVPQGTKVRIDAVRAGTTMDQRDVHRQALLCGLRQFELDGIEIQRVPDQTKAKR